MNTRYKFIIFNQAKAGHSLKTVLENLAKELKIPPEKLAQSLAKKPLTLKQNLTKEQALRYKQFAERIGISYKITSELGEYKEHKEPTVETKDISTAKHKEKSTRNILKYILPVFIIGLLILAFGFFFYLAPNTELNAQTQNDIGQNFSNHGGRWTLMSTEDAPSPRWGHTAGWTGSRYWVYGGTRSGPDSLRTGALFDPTTNTWESMSVEQAPNSLVTQSGAASEILSSEGGQINAISYWTGSKILVWGGIGASVAHANGRYYVTQANRQVGGGFYNPAARQWSAINEQNAHKFNWGAFHAFTGNQLIVWGGMGAKQPDNQGAIYELASDTWKTMSEAPILGRDTGCSVWTGTDLFIFGGRTTESSTSSDGALYNPNSDKWTLLPTQNAPSSRNSPMCALISQKRIVVWGGTAPDDQPLGDGKIYHFDSHTWSDMATANAPTPRNQSRVVWTGKYLIVWAGGNNGSHGNTGLTSGALYDPDANNGIGEWLTMATNDAPQGLRVYTTNIPLKTKNLCDAA